MYKMKTFKDLEFKPHRAGSGKQATLFFPNGYGVSVVFGTLFYSNGVDTYEMAVLRGNENDYRLTYETPITDDVLGRRTAEEITKAMKEVQKLPGV